MLPLLELVVQSVKYRSIVPYLKSLGPVVFLFKCSSISCLSMGEISMVDKLVFLIPLISFPILVMPSIRLGSNTYQFLNYRVDSARVRTQELESHDLPELKVDARLIRQSHLILGIQNLLDLRIKVFF